METQLRHYQGKSARMSRLVTILRAAHCRSTHHYIAIDSLPLIATVSGQRLAQLLLKYHDEYLVGAKAPDKAFRDFQNHVLHVNQNNWGGAPKACQKWYDEAVDLLAAKKWKKAAYACGVLSHYFTDPFMPLHTAQSDRESIVHRPLEWSVCKSYEALFARSNEKRIQPIALSNSDDWISEAVTEGARRSNAIYSTIIDDYDLERGCKVPTEGLGAASREGLSEVIGLTLRSWADVLIRLADAADVEIPDVSLTLSTLLATIDMPLAWIVRKISDTNEQAAVKRIFKEYKSTGTVRRNAPAEVKKVAMELAKAQPATTLRATPEATTRDKAATRDKATPRDKATTISSPTTSSSHAPSKSPPESSFSTLGLAPQPQTTRPADTANASRPEPSSPSTAVTNQTTAPPDRASSPAAANNSLQESTPTREPAPYVVPSNQSSSHSNKVTLSEARAQASAGYVQKTVQAQQDSEQKVASVPRDESASSSEKTTQSATAQSPPAQAPLSEIAGSENAESKHVQTSHVQTSPRKTGRRSTPNVSVNTRVALDSDLVDAPSIGPKTAARFAKIGIHSIRQFVEADPGEMHRGLDTRWITEQLIGEWQDQAKLVCEVPVLCGYKAQLLVAAGCRTSRDLARSVPADLYQRVAHVARGIDGQRILRSAKPPASQDISSWITAALESKSSKAA